MIDMGSLGRQRKGMVARPPHCDIHEKSGQKTTKPENFCNKSPNLEYIHGRGFSKEAVMSVKYPEILTLQQAAEM